MSSDWFVKVSMLVDEWTSRGWKCEAKCGEQPERGFTASHTGVEGRVERLAKQYSVHCCSPLCVIKVRWWIDLVVPAIEGVGENAMANGEKAGDVNDG